MVPRPSQVLAICGANLAPLDNDGQVPLFGFGDDSPATNFKEDGAPCAGFVDLMAVYRARITPLLRKGTTSLVPAITKAVELVKKGTREFTVALILCDGSPNDIGASERAILAASALPIAFICVGLGDGPWGGLQALDDSTDGRGEEGWVPPVASLCV